MMRYYYIDNDLSKAQGVNGDLDWLVMNHFCEPIDNYKDWVIIVSFLIRQNW